jgi:uncharacterized membrane protein HdeD (DUF308 family)
MTTVLTRNWWALALRGVFAILLGLAALVLPGVTLAVFVALFGAYAIVDGVLAIIAGVGAAERHERWWSPVLKGLAGIVAGVLAFVWPALTTLALLYLIAAWAIVTGVLEIVVAVHLHRAHGEWLLVLNGILSVLFGLFIIVWPGAGVLTLLWMIGVYAIVFGVVLLVLAFRLRNLQGARQSAVKEFSVGGSLRVQKPVDIFL